MDIYTRDTEKALFERHLGVTLPTSSKADEVYERTKRTARESLFFLATAVLGYGKVQRNPHLELCNFIQDQSARRKCVLIPRDCYKSTIGSKSFPIWVLIQTDFCGLPGREHRILLKSFSSENARKQIKAIRQQCERNEMLRWLFPEIIPDLARTTWTDSNLLFPREGYYGEDTIESAGIDTHIVSRHYTIQIDDDLEDKQSFESPTVRERVRSLYKSSEALFVEERSAFHLLIGTRWGVDDIYSEIQRNESETYKFLVRPLHWTRDQLIEDHKEAQLCGQPPTWNMDAEVYAPEPDKTYYFFPTLFPEDSCQRIRAKQGSFMYSMLYLNNPKDPSLAEFKPSDLRYYGFDDEGNIRIDHGGGEYETVPFDLTRRVLFWDPALSSADKKRNSRNAMVAMAKDFKGRLFVLAAWAERKDPTLLFARFISLHRRWGIQSAAIEDVAFQRILKFPLYHEMMEQNWRFPVNDHTPVGDKDTRIRSLIPFVESHMLFVQTNQKDLMEELKQFPLFPTKDLVDAAAACIELLGTAKVQNQAPSRNSYAAEDRSRATASPLTGY